ncbi:Hydrogenase maturation protein, carbamoyl dehydratase HypE [Thermodesulfobium acidiphilum]|uniref:Hydrogenase maturation protein, carbamoyl dehydratase HypE n=1 Tax=Thermodesulfobium acidiphilum TaxID=1794699 RepID=A0A2R4W0A0_THEAF|nr:hydrogenase expression/formation protein HypE [Thermodesulfobium acidiphilum]AWB10134.1 Hydrogenase maturation protein, carbamoyl dehydratase HypE [Thermodesulfobium acidiphilum]
MSNIITLAHGAGGRLTSELIENVFSIYLEKPLKFDDAAVLDFSGRENELTFCTDVHLVKPIFFPGGNLSLLAIYGTINDLVAMGSKPLYLTLGWIIEEGVEISLIKELANEIKKASDECNVKVVAGDTKVVPKGQGDGVYLSVSGVGQKKSTLSINSRNIKENDVFIITGTIADHGCAIMLAREDFPLKSNIKSDCACLDKLILPAVERFQNEIHAMRDPTRGGLSTVLNEFASSSNICIEVDEAKVPIKDEIYGLLDPLGLDPFTMTCEGKMLIACSPDIAEELLNMLKSHPLGKDAAIIGTATNKVSRRVILNTKIGGKRFLDMPIGENLPRIC